MMTRTARPTLVLALVGTLGHAAETAPDVGPALEHGELRAADVDAYIDAYRHRAAANRIEYDGRSRTLSFVAFDDDGVVFDYDDGVLIVETEEGEISGPFTLLEGDVTRIGDGEGAFLESVTRRLSGDGLEESDEERFEATATDEASGETIAVSGAVDETIVAAGRVFLDVDGENLHVSGLLGARSTTRSTCTSVASSVPPASPRTCRRTAARSPAAPTCSSPARPAPSSPAG